MAKTKERKNMKEKIRYLTIVPNNEFGKEIISSIKSLAKRNGWRVVCRGRCKNRKSAAERHARENKLHFNFTHASFRQDIPIKYADRFAVYVKTTDIDRNNRFITSERLAELALKNLLK